MLRLSAMAFLLASTQCMTGPDRTGGSVGGSVGGQTGGGGMAQDCGAAAHQTLIGAPAAAAQGIVHDGPLRVLRPGQPMTMDFSATRLNVLIDDTDRIANIWCG